MPRISECPCCGGYAERRIRKTRKGMRSQIKCTACGLQTGLCKTNGSDIYIWNRRTEKEDADG